MKARVIFLDSELKVSAIGPFKFDHQRKQVTLEPGVYTLRSPITFGMLESTEIHNLLYEAEKKK